MENFSIECMACGQVVGHASRAESVPNAVAHLQNHHRAVKFPHPALDLIRLHPYYTLDVLAAADEQHIPVAAVDDQTTQPPAEEEPGAPGGGENTGPATTLN